MIEERLLEMAKGWATATINELIDNNGVFIDGDWVESKDQDPSGGVRLVQLADIGDGVYRDKSNRFLTLDKAVQLHCTFLKNDDVLIARMPNPLGRACLFPGDPKPCVTVVDVCIVRLNPNFANNRWFMHAINSPAFRSDISSLQSGSTRKRISRGNLAKLKLPLPPLPEQRAIVSKIEQLFSDLDNGIENFKKAQEQLKIYRQAVLKNACEGKLVPTEAELARSEGRDYEPADVLLTRILEERREKWNGKGKYKKPEAADTSELAELPEGWRWARFEQIVSLSQNGFGKRSSKEGNPTIVLRLADITNGEISLDNVRRIGATIGEIEKYKLFDNDIICIRVNGSRNLVGRMIKCKPIHDTITFCDHFIRFQLVVPTMASFFSMYFDTDKVRKYVDVNKVSSAGQNTVSQVTIMAIPVPLPPFAEQHRIITEVERRLSICDKMEETIAESLQKAESLRQSILKKAFEGKLLSDRELEEVRNAPDWEPAEKLLERIKAEKTNVKAKKKGKK